MIDRLISMETIQGKTGSKGSEMVQQDSLLQKIIDNLMFYTVELKESAGKCLVLKKKQNIIRNLNIQSVILKLLQVDVFSLP